MANRPGQPSSAITAVLTDVDGTLVTKDKVLTPRAIAAVHELQARGVLFAITSGRPPRGMRMLVEPLGMEIPMAAFNGGMIVMPDMTIVDERTLHVLRDDGSVRSRLEVAPPGKGTVSLDIHPTRNLLLVADEARLVSAHDLDGAVRLAEDEGVVGRVGGVVGIGIPGPFQVAQPTAVEVATAAIGRRSKVVGVDRRIVQQRPPIRQLVIELELIFIRHRCIVPRDPDNHRLEIRVL